MIPAQPGSTVDLCSPEEALKRIVASRTAPLPDGVPAGSRTIWVCGSGLARNAAVFCPLDIMRPSPDGTRPKADEGAPIVTRDELVTPGINALCLLARHGEFADEDIEPLYVRPCDAVENLPQLAPRQGLTGEEAATSLERLLQRPPQSDI